MTDLQKLLREQASTWNVPGAVVGVLDGGTETIAAFGVTSVEHPLEVDRDTLFQIGSITKTYTGTAIMRLVERGVLGLDEPVRTYLPSLRLLDEGVAAQVTMRHLLTHTGGWVGDYFNAGDPGDDALERMVERLVDLPQLTPLGEVWAYNNAGFYIAGRVVEVLVGRPFEQALRELLLEPLGLERSFFTAEDVITHRFSVGHDREGKVGRPWGIGRASAAVGGIVCSVPELLRYARFHLGDGDGILSRDSLELMRKPQVKVVGIGDWVGLTWYGEELSGLTFVRHGGGTMGQIAHLELCPSEGWALAVVTNHTDGGALVRAVRRELILDRFGVVAPEPEPLEASQEQLDEVVGTYEAALTLVGIRSEDTKLIASISSKGGFPNPDTPPGPAQPPVQIMLLSDDRFAIVDGSAKGVIAEFLRDDDGAIVWLRFGGRLFRRL